MTTRKATKTAATVTASRKGTKEIPYVLKPNFLQITLQGQPFTLDSTHPTFLRLKKALEQSNWKAVPKLVSLAQTLVTASAGNVTIQKGVVCYKDTAIDSRFTNRMLDMIKGEKEVRHMMLFLDDLYKNPEPKAISEFADWLMDNDLPITDDGCFLAYKSVDGKLKDEHTHTIDNSPGQMILMPRDSANKNWREQCSSGFHVCSKQYGLYGSRIMAVKIHPRDVIAANSGKMRVLRYEVLYELGSKSESLFKEEGFSQLEKKLVVEVKAERKELVKLLGASKQFKKLIKDGKLSADYLQRAAFGRIMSLAQRLKVVPEQYTQEAQAETPPPALPLQSARKAAGLTVGQMAKEMHVDYKTVSRMENKPEASDKDVDRFLYAIAKLVGIGSLSRSAITFPTPVKAKVA